MRVSVRPAPRRAARALTALAILLAGCGLLAPRPVEAQACLGTTTVVLTVTAGMASMVPMGSAGPLYNFLSPGCITSMFGPMAPTGCSAVKNPLGFLAGAYALFPSPAANMTSNGCVFICAAGAAPCTVRGGDGLPVELMAFSVEPVEEADGDDTEAE